MGLALQVAITGLSAGAVYGLVAVGHAVIYRLTGIVHFAFGDLIGLGVFTTLWIAVGTAPTAASGVDAARFVPALVVGGATCAVAGALSYLLVVAPYLTRGSTIGWIGATVAIAFAIRALLEGILSRPAYVLPDPLPFRDIARGGFVTVGGASIQVRAFYVIAVGLVLAGLATWTLRRTRFGRALQAIASDAEAARIVGIPILRLTALAFAFAGALAAVAAVTAAPSGPFSPATGTLLGLKGLVAAVVAGLASPGRAFTAGLGLGVVEAAIAGLTIAGHGLGPEYREIVPLALAVAWIASRRFGEAVEEADE